jgi:hypothetical protein
MTENQIAMGAVIEEALKVTPREEIMDRLPKPLAAPKETALDDEEQGGT